MISKPFLNSKNYHIISKFKIFFLMTRLTKYVYILRLAGNKEGFKKLTAFSDSKLSR